MCATNVLISMSLNIVIKVHCYGPLWHRASGLFSMNIQFKTYTIKTIITPKVIVIIMVGNFPCFHKMLSPEL